MKMMLNLLAIAALALAAGCTTSSKDISQASGPTETCHVCRYNNDLACVQVRVRDTTPRAEYGGRTFYFCSEACRTEFLKKPEKYLPPTANP
jgi:YHS domain-containing protein